MVYEYRVEQEIISKAPSSPPSMAHSNPLVFFDPVSDPKHFTMRTRSVYRPVCLFVFLLATCTATQSSGVPSAPEVSRVLQSAIGGSNNPVAQALNSLASDLGFLSNAIFNGITSILGDLPSILGPNPELKYSYGQSPPVYPAPVATGYGDWSEAYQQARSIVAQMTNEEKNNITFGYSTTHGCSGFTGTVPRLEFPGICLQDAENGVRSAELVNGYPAQLSIGASFNRSLALERARFIGREFKAKGANVLNGPVIGPIGRMAKNGRNWESFGSDPYLNGQLAGPTVQGFQESVIAAVKHFAAYEQETHRLPFLSGFVLGLGIQSVSSSVDDRTMHELYLWPFYDAVKAGAGSVMCSYNRVNNSYASQNSKMLNGLLKTELGFQGFVLSDWFAQRTGIASAQAGLDLAMPYASPWADTVLATAVSNKSMSVARLDDMATRILASWFKLAKFDQPGLDAHASVDARDPAAEAVILEGAIQGHVLVKNINNALPLNPKPPLLNVFGFSAAGGLNATTTGKSYTSDVSAQFALLNTPNYTTGSAFTEAAILLFFAESQSDQQKGPGVALGGTLLSGGGSGAVNPQSSTAPLDALVAEAATYGGRLNVDTSSPSPRVVNGSTAPCLVFINEQASESWDRAGLADPYADALVIDVAGKCRNTVVVIHNAGVRLVDAWFEHPNVTAVVFAHTPGQASGRATVELLFGRRGFSGRLPYTVPRAERDFGALLGPCLPTVRDPKYPQCDFVEGLDTDYRHFIRGGITPRFAFGYGLTYSNFSYADLSIQRVAGADFGLVPPDALRNPSIVAPEGGLASLYDELVTVSVVVTNTGSSVAAEVAQLYLDTPGGPEKVLRGFEKEELGPGQSSSIVFKLTRRDLSSWDVIRQQWVLQVGTYRIFVGKSVLNIQLTGSISFAG